MTRAEKAESFFKQGYNCAQAIALAFEDLLPVNGETLTKLTSSFGGGMGRLREVCGAMSSAFAVCGMLYGYSGPETGEPKAQHYARIQELAKRFEAKWGTIVCRELLELEVKHDSSVPEARTAQYYEKRPCPRIIYDAAEILDEYIEEQNK